MIVSLSLEFKTPVRMSVWPSFTLIEPLSSLLTDKRSIIPHPLISLVEDDALTEGEMAKVMYPLSSILKT